MVTPADRPAPVREAARLWGLVVGSVGALASFLVTSQVISSAQSEALASVFTSSDVLISAVVALITAGSTALAAFSTASTSEPQVTPVVSPAVRDAEGRLVALVPATAAGEI